MRAIGCAGTGVVGGSHALILYESEIKTYVPLLSDYGINIPIKKRKAFIG